jgi:cytochrome d ubiquinol oxidase subunit II
MMDATLLPAFWAGLIAFAIIVYVLLDGFDLGVGILFGTVKREDYRAHMFSAIAPVWDGNETWLILVGASLFGAFPVVYAIFLSAFYLPVALLLFALIFRGVAFEFRNRAGRMRSVWDWGFFLGSLIAAFVQGAAIGNMVQVLTVEDRYFAGGSFDWVNPFGILCGVGLVVGYALLGASWLVHKTDGELQEWAAARIPWLLIGVVGFIVLALLFVLFNDLRVMQRWSERPWLWVLPLLGATAAVLVFRWRLHRGRDATPFLLTLLIFLAAYLMLGGSFWPYMIPYSISIDDAANPTASLLFMFYGAAVVVFPVVLIYTAGVYWIFRGKVGTTAEYR